VSRFPVPFLLLAHALLDLGEIGPDELSVHRKFSTYGVGAG
jgi:hypothetical protein